MPAASNQRAAQGDRGATVGTRRRFVEDTRVTVKLIDENALGVWVEALIRAGTVYGVQARDQRFVFDHLTKATDLRLDYDVTLLPPKKYFHPQREVLSTFDRYSLQFESVVDPSPFVLFGVHPYDMEAITLLDKTFEQDHPDVHYLTRRENATIVVVDVENPSPEVFAGCMGTATCEGRSGFDVLLTRIDDSSYLIETRSPKGEALASQIADATDATPANLEARQQTWDRLREALKQHQLNTNPADLPELLARSEQHPVWEEKAELCLSCGSCNLVCPTCYCFDVHDELNWDMATGKRVRTWDGCMLAKFAAVAGGHNFRNDKAARYRHRYYRKGKYSFEMIGNITCVGCGRCIQACPSDIANPVEIFNRLLEATS